MDAGVQHESSSLSAYLRVLRRRKWIVLACAVLVPSTALLLSLRQTDLYRSSAAVYLNKQNIASAVTGIPDTTLLVDEERAAETQVNLASVPDVARRALRNAGVSGMSTDEFLAGASARTKGNSDLLEFSIDSPDPMLAKRLASAYALAFTQYRGELDTAAVKRARQEVAAKLRTLEAERKKGSPFYATLVEKEQQLSTLETLQTSRAYVVRTADDAWKVAPQPTRNALLGLMLGLVLGIGLAFAIDALDTRVRSAGEVGHYLGLPLLARVPPPPRGFSKENRLTMLEQPTGTNAEAFRMLRTNLDFVRLEGDDVRTIVVTSAVEQEGKSTTAANLALAEARAGKRVALVDLDLRSPSIHRLFGLPHARGITDVALGRLELEAALGRIGLDARDPAAISRAVPYPTNGRRGHGTLDVLVAGTLPPDPGEFVGTGKVAEILAQLRLGYDVVILDTPPALRVGDALVLSARADAILVVTRLKVVRRPLLMELRRQLLTIPAPKLGYVVTGGDEGSRYGYGYGYGDRSGEYGYTEEAEPLGALASAPGAAKGVRPV